MSALGPGCVKTRIPRPFAQSWNPKQGSGELLLRRQVGGAAGLGEAARPSFRAADRFKSYYASIDHLLLLDQLAGYVKDRHVRQSDSREYRLRSAASDASGRACG